MLCTSRGFLEKVLPIVFLWGDWDSSCNVTQGTEYRHCLQSSLLLLTTELGFLMASQ